MRLSSRAAVTFVLAAALTGGLVLAVPAFALGAAPTLVLAMFLCAGMFPGETAIARLREHRAVAGRRRPAVQLRLPRPRALAASGRLVICFSLANRPPPVLVLSA